MDRFKIPPVDMVDALSDLFPLLNKNEALFT